MSFSAPRIPAGLSGLKKYTSAAVRLAVKFPAATRKSIVGLRGVIEAQ